MSDSAVRAAQQEREREREQQLHHLNLNGHDPELAEGIYESMLNDIVSTSLSEGSKDMMKNLLTKDFVLANLNRAELNEFKWKLRVKKEIFFAMHPTQDCLVVGERRAAINDDPSDTLRPLTKEMKWEVDNVFDGIWMRSTRALGMQQQKMLNTQIRESKVDRGERAGGNGIIDKLRRR